MEISSWPAVVSGKLGYGNLLQESDFRRSLIKVRFATLTSLFAHLLCTLEAPECITGLAVRNTRHCLSSSVSSSVVLKAYSHSRDGIFRIATLSHSRVSVWQAKHIAGTIRGPETLSKPLLLNTVS